MYLQWILAGLGALIFIAILYYVFLKHGRLTSTIRNKIDQQQYVISTAPKGQFWETAVFMKDPSSPLPFDIFHPLRRSISLTFQEAKKEHSAYKDIVENLPRSEWRGIQDQTPPTSST